MYAGVLAHIGERERAFHVAAIGLFLVCLAPVHVGPAGRAGTVDHGGGAVLLERAADGIAVENIHARQHSTR